MEWTVGAIFRERSGGGGLRDSTISSFSAPPSQPSEYNFGSFYRSFASIKQKNPILTVI